ncbi:hypothetical protein AAK684_05975 [Leptogranulimonas caecicola]|nr:MULTISPECIES: hypothetical protein [Atopobiaceae]
MVNISTSKVSAWCRYSTVTVQSAARSGTLLGEIHGDVHGREI